MFESMRIYIERFGRPYNYLSSSEELHEKRHEHLQKEETEQNADTAQKTAKVEAEQRQLILSLEKLADKRLVEI